MKRNQQLDRSHGVLSSPFPSCCFIFGLVGFVDVCDLWYQRVIGVGVCEKTADRQQNFHGGQGWGPLLFQDIQADGAIGVDVWVVNSRGEIELRWLEWVVSWEVDVQEVDTTGIR